MSDLLFRLLRREDLPLVGRWLARPHVARWWPDPSDPVSLAATYGPAIDGTDPTEVFVVEQDGEPLGLVQRYETADHPRWARTLAATGLTEPSAGIDYLIGDPDRTGRGLGPQIIERFVGGIWPRYPGVAVIAVAVAQANRRSWRALEKSGFRRVWAGRLESDDPSDAGPSYLYLRRRDPGAGSGRSRPPSPSPSLGAVGVPGRRRRA